MKKYLVLFILISLTSVSCKQSKKRNTIPDPAVNGDSGMSGLRQATVPGYVPTTLNFRQLADSMIALSGVTNQMDIEGIYEDWERQKAQLPKEGALSEITPSAWNSVFFLAAKVCDAIKTAPSSNELSQVSQFYAGRFLGRTLASDEIAVLAAELGSQSDLSTRNQLICTVIASSAEAIKI